jgi:hypothetical protein
MNQKRGRALLGAVAAAALAGTAAPLLAQTAPGGGVPTETQEREAAGLGKNGFDWNWIGLIGLFGLAGLHRRPDYHDPI